MFWRWSHRVVPQMMVTDNGPEFAGKVLDAWAYRRGVTLHFIRPGEPVENAYIESFNGKFRDECLNEHWFTSLAHARDVIEGWRKDYNEARPHKLAGERHSGGVCALLWDRVAVAYGFLCSVPQRW